jgi:eukaryotic-like serine/threonine-protein kinase
MSADWQRAGTVFSDDGGPEEESARRTAAGRLAEPRAGVACPEVGTVIHGVYRVIDQLATGGMGVVMLACDEQLQREVAIKFVRPELLEHGNLRERFVAEARAMARVRHPNVVQIYAFGDHRGAPYFVMEFIKGQTVQTLLRASREGGPALDLALVLRLIDDTCKGVAAIHAAGTVHRDLKPSNLLLDAALDLRVTDFGVADLLQRLGTNGEREIVGTPEYMAPEIVVGDDVAPELAYRADVYSLGCLTFELLTGTPPFAGEEVLERMVAHVVRDAPRPSERCPGLTRDFDEVVLGALAKDPAKRTPSVEAFRRALLAARDQPNDPVRILLADDDDDFRHLLSVNLEREFPGVEIECVGDGDAALAAFDPHHHSAAIIDLQMPGLDAIELTRQLRAQDGASTVPIIVITASGGASEWKRLSAIGADGFLVKPFDVKDVVALLRRAIGHRRSASGAPPSQAPGALT